MTKYLARAFLLAVLAVAWVAWPNVTTHPTQKVEEYAWVVTSTPKYKGHSPNLPDAVVCTEQKFEGGVNVGREKVVRVDDVNRYAPGDTCPEGDR